MSPESKSTPSTAAAPAGSTAARDPRQRILVFDTTLRDGEQCPGGSMTPHEKMQVARMLEAMHVDVIEAGFPIASPGDFESVKAIAGEITHSTVAGLARSLQKDIKSAADAVGRAKKPRIHVFLATSAIHREFKLKKAKEEILKQAVDAVKYAKGFVSDVEFSPEDASRTEWEFLTEVVQAVIEAGATTVNIPDTVGYAVPSEYAGTIEHLMKTVPNIGQAVVSVHCHNDLGLAVANSLAAVRAGARQIECTINGIGERAGNTSLEEVVMALKTRHDAFGGFHTAIDTTKIVPASRLVSEVTGLVVQPNKAIVGENAFAHEAGIHQDGMLKDRRTYEIMNPADVGLSRSSLVIGKHSGRHSINDRVRELGFDLTKEEQETVYAEVIALADKKKKVFDADIEAIVEKVQGTLNAPAFKLVRLQFSSGTQTLPTAAVTLADAQGEERTAAAVGDGPVAACIEAIDRITGLKGNLTDYRVTAVTNGSEALGEVHVRVEFDGEKIAGRGYSTDVIEGSVLAYLMALNRHVIIKAKRLSSAKNPAVAAQ